MQILRVSLLQLILSQSGTLDFLKRQIHQFEFFDILHLPKRILVLNNDYLILRVDADSRSHSWISDFDELDLTIDKAAVFIEKFAEELLLKTHVCWRTMASRVAYNDVLDIGTAIDIEGIVQLVHIIDASGVHHELKGNGSAITSLFYWHLEAVLVNNDVGEELPVLGGA